MARSHRFHIDRSGHSVTVQIDRVRDETELLVDGKVVAYQQAHSKGVAVLAAELPGDPPRPFTVRVDRSHRVGGLPVCVMEADGTRYPMPLAPLAPARTPLASAATPVRPVRRLRRLLRRYLTARRRKFRV